jgi:hypothetical protein
MMPLSRRREIRGVLYFASETTEEDERCLDCTHLEFSLRVTQPGEGMLCLMRNGEVLAEKHLTVEEFLTSNQSLVEMLRWLIPQQQAAEAREAATDQALLPDPMPLPRLHQILTDPTDPMSLVDPEPEGSPPSCSGAR